MKLKIQRPSTYIRYKDAELTAEEQYHYELFQNFCDTYPEMVRRAADPAWGPAPDRANERLIQDEIDAGA